MKITSGPAIGKPGEMAAILSNLQEGDILFVDEIHRLNRQVEEVLYPAMEDFQLDLIIGEGPAARSVKIDLAKFTCQEIRLLLIIPLYIDIVTGMQDRFQKSDRIFRVNNLSFC